MLKYLYAAVIVALLCLLVLAAPTAHADGWQNKLAVTVAAAPNDGPVFGAGVGYPVGDLWADLFVRREVGSTDVCAGVSTSLQPLLDIVGSLLSFDVGELPAGAAGGCATPLEAWEPFAYLAYHTSF